MAKGDLLGHIQCPCCDFEAVVKEAKNGKPYAFCENCNVQIFTRYEHQAKGMLKKMKPVVSSVTDTGEGEKNQPVTVTEKPKKTGFDLGL